MKNKPSPKTGINIMNKNATRPPLIKAITDENIIIKGALITMRIHIWKDC